MRRIPLYQIDAFADGPFQGNPAAVCPLSAWLPDETLQAMAAENALSETAFLRLDGDPVPLRWFTPTQEVPLCGHATLAAGYVVLSFLRPDRETVTFSSKSGRLTVSRREGGFSVDLPAVRMERVREVPEALGEGLGAETVEAGKTAEAGEAVRAGGTEVWATPDDPNYLVILESEEAVASLTPDLRILERLHPHGVAVSAPGASADFVSRYFAPGYGIPEDPVTGSIHCALGPYWAERTGRASLEAIQLSRRGGRIGVEVEGDRVRLAGRAVCYLVGEALVP